MKGASNLELQALIVELLDGLERFGRLTGLVGVNFHTPVERLNLEAARTAIDQLISYKNEPVGRPHFGGLSLSTSHERGFMAGSGNYEARIQFAYDIDRNRYMVRIDALKRHEPDLRAAIAFARMLAAREAEGVLPEAPPA